MGNHHFKATGIKEFGTAVREFLIPLTYDFQLALTEISPRLFALTSPKLSVKIYLPECHGYDIDIMLTPAFSPEWYTPAEMNLIWFGRYFGLGDFKMSRCVSVNQIPVLVKTKVVYLKHVLVHPNLQQASLWNDLQVYIREWAEDEAVQADERGKASRLGDARLQAEVAWQGKDYAKVVAIYEAIRDQLTSAEAKRYKYANKRK